MLRALLERRDPAGPRGRHLGRRDQRAVVAADPTTGAVERLADLWLGRRSSDLFAGSVFGRLSARWPGPARPCTRTAAARPADRAPRRRPFEDLPVPFQCVAASIERAAEHWFTHGPLVDAVLASCAVPGAAAAGRVAGRPTWTAGWCNSIPVGRAVALGADHGLRAPGRPDRAAARGAERPWEVARSRSRSPAGTGSPRDMAALPPGSPCTSCRPARRKRAADLRSQLRYRDPVRDRPADRERIRGDARVSRALIPRIANSSILRPPNLGEPRMPEPAS